jgi:peptidoglycan/LPS O-acetylase OafA/YrhL
MLKPLTSLRFFAAAAVVLAHVGILNHAGGVAVGFFFVLSGFILTYTYGMQCKKLSATFVRDFYIKRFGRIYPMHIVTLIAAIPLLHYLPKYPSATATVANIFLMQSWFPMGADIFSYNGVAWTLSIEWFFYLMFPFFAWALHRTKIFNSALGGAALALGTFACFIAAQAYLNRIPMERNGALWWFANVSPFGMFTFVIGMGVAIWFMHARDRIRLSQAQATSIEMFAIGSIALGCFVFVPGSTNALRSPSAAFLPPFILIVSVFALGAGSVSKALSAKLAVRLGETSFSLYMTHQIILFYMMFTLGMPLIGKAGSSASQIIYLVACMTFSELGFRFIEDPCRRLINNRIARHNMIMAPEDGTSIRHTSTSMSAQD